MHKIIDLVTSGIILFVVIYNNVHILERLGGSAILLTMCALIYFLSYAYRRLQSELSLIIIFALILIGMNYLSYAETEKVYPYSYILIGFGILTLLLIICFLILNIKVIRKDPTSEFKMVEISRRIIQRLSVIPLWGLVGLVIPSGFVFIINPSSEVIKQGWIRYTPLAVFWLFTSFVITFIDLRRIDKKYILYVLSKNERFNTLNLKKYFINATLILFILGSGMEISRGFWILWIETASLFVVLIIASWTIWKYVFEDDMCDLTDVNLEGLESIGTNFSYFLKFLSVYVLIVTLYLVTLAIICS